VDYAQFDPSTQTNTPRTKNMTKDVFAHSVKLRPGFPSDVQPCARIVFNAFSAIAAQHNFPSDIPSIEVGAELMTMLLTHPHFFSVVAELDDQIVGSNFLDERSAIAGVGPITVEPTIQNRGLGRRLMEAVLNRASDKAHPGVRLLQSAYHGRSLALYSTMGFQVREGIACMQGAPIGVSLTGYPVRPAREEDIEACDRICRFVHGHDRHRELLDAVKLGTAKVVEHDGRITGYATDFGFFGHAAAETTRDLIALIGSASAFTGPGILVPMRNAPLFQWCLSQRLKVVQVLTLMTRGLYNEPAGAYLPTVLF
jgi:predicted N-acetyltransferase YhbS